MKKIIATVTLVLVSLFAAPNTVSAAPQLNCVSSAASSIPCI